ncbi:helix-turn-helix transcriptional regulator [Flavobacteriaceae bacterium TP-CH-4]|uniref:Helix-turn-helix transcriptional regulator n=1 Tax=Pelagihabitans pacificus TaxID=2696054 RepID=A0A967E8Z2_9FLAO|nr:AraC family transcriptional regulator [Pelagihabitans pacificus]NHF57991.1 helix-turn-helix transcriptional regulator [Pelagihabitans pacificus]
MIKHYQQFDLFGKKIFEKAIIEPPFRGFYHMPNEACFFYLKEGSCNLFAPSSKVKMKIKEGVVLQCGNYLFEMLSSGESTYGEALAVHLHPEVLKMIYDKEFPDFLLEVDKVRPLRMERYPATELLRNYIENLEFYFDNPHLVSDELLKLKLKELILLLARTDNAETVRTVLASLFSSDEIGFKEVIEKNVYNNLNLEELAQLANLSLSSFKREFKKHYKSPPAKYIKKRKLEKASKLLKGTRMRISDIAYDCGFSDLAHFSKSFQRNFQLSPTSYRTDLMTRSMTETNK